MGEKSRVGEEESRKRVARIVKASQEEAGDSEVLCLEVGRRLKLLCPVTFVKCVGVALAASVVLCRREGAAFQLSDGVLSVCFWFQNRDSQSRPGLRAFAVLRPGRLRVCESPDEGLQQSLAVSSVSPARPASRLSRRLLLPQNIERDEFGRSGSGAPGSQSAKTQDSSDGLCRSNAGKNREFPSWAFGCSL